MATPVMVTVTPPARKAVEVVIDLDPKTKKIRVSPDPFWISVSAHEEVVWVCKQRHEHGHNKCLLVHFGDNGSPFLQTTFVDHLACTGCAVVPPDPSMLYKYTLWVPGHEPLDPQGGVTP